MADTRLLTHLLERVRRRIRTHQAIHSLAWGLLWAGPCAIGALICFRLGFGQSFLTACLAICVVGVVGGSAVGWLAPVLQITAARAIDTSHGLRDRTVSAWEFLQTGRDDNFRDAAIVDALSRAKHVNIRLAVPWTLPKDMRALGLLFVAAFACLILHPLSRDVSARPKTAGISLEGADLILGRVLAEEISLSDAPINLQALGAELQKLYRDIDSRTLSDKDLLARISTLENKALRGLPESKEQANFEAALSRLAESLLREALTKPAGHALRQDDLARAKAELEQLAEEASHVSNQEQRRLKKAMSQASQALGPKDPPGRSLERLKRNLEQAAQAQSSADLGRALQDLANDFGTMEEEVRKLELAERIRMALAEIREAMGQAGQRQLAKPAQNSGDKQAGGKSSERTTAEFLARAGRSRREGNTKTLLAPSGQSQNQTGVELQTQGIGNQHDPHLGDPARLKADHRNVEVDATQGPGESRSEVILSAGQQGFSVRGYQRVYRDYAALVEEVLETEDITPGKRDQVKRYFELIHPNP